MRWGTRQSFLQLEATWQMIEDALNCWNIVDLAQTYPLPYQGKNYALTRQWIIWHVIAHDLHLPVNLPTDLRAVGAIRACKRPYGVDENV